LQAYAALRQVTWKETDMSKRVYFYWPPALSVVLTLVCVGCTPERSSTLTSQPLCCAGLDEYREIELSHDVLREREGLERERKYERLVLRIRPRPGLRSKRVLKTIERRPGERGAELRFWNVVARTDATRQKVWFVERGTGRILATVDLLTGRTTGPDDEPPAWAEPDGGQPMDSACESGVSEFLSL
jgi:hypothetical protein